MHPHELSLLHCFQLELAAILNHRSDQMYWWVAYCKVCTTSSMHRDSLSIFPFWVYRGHPSPPRGFFYSVWIVIFSKYTRRTISTHPRYVEFKHGWFIRVLLHGFANSSCWDKRVSSPCVMRVLVFPFISSFLYKHLSILFFLHHLIRFAPSLGCTPSPFGTERSSSLGQRVCMAWPDRLPLLCSCSFYSERACRRILYSSR